MELGDLVLYAADVGERVELRPAMVTRVHTPLVVNLQVYCDGDDALLLGSNSSVPRLSVTCGGAIGQWRPRPKGPEQPGGPASADRHAETIAALTAEVARLKELAYTLDVKIGELTALIAARPAPPAKPRRASKR